MTHKFKNKDIEVRFQLHWFAVSGLMAVTAGLASHPASSGLAATSAALLLVVPTVLSMVSNYVSPFDI